MTEKKRLRRGKGTGSIFRPKGSRYWWVAYTSGGKRRYESTKSERKGDAQTLLTDRLGDTGKGITVVPKMGRKILGDGLKAVVDNLRMNGKKSAVCSRCKIACCGVEGHTNDALQRIEHLLKYFASDRRMSTISTDDIEAYKAHRIDQQAKPATVNRELAMLRRAFRLAMRGGALAAMPYVGLLQEHNVRQGFFEHDQFETILTHLPAELHAPLKFAYATGWRFTSEVLPLTVDRVDLQAGVVRLDPGSTKSGQGRSFYVTDQLTTILEAQLDSIDALQQKGLICPYVFHRPDGSQIKSFRKTWRKACDAAGYPGKLFHDFRRTAVRNLERAAVPRSTAMAMVGHQTESIYKRYAIVDEAMHREAAALLNVWASGQQAKADATRKGQLKRFAKAEAR